LAISTLLSATTCAFAQTDDTETSVPIKKEASTATTLVINEIQSKNVDQFLNPSQYASLNYSGWIELYNPTSKYVSLSNWYISDDPDNLKKHHLAKNQGTVASHGFKSIYFGHNDRYHNDYLEVSFKLDCDGGTIYLSDSNGNLILSQEYPAGIGRTSYARTTDGGEEWGITPTPTPGKTNATSTFATEQLKAPKPDITGCMFTVPFSVNVGINDQQTLRYTTDGSTPTESSAISDDGHFEVSKTAVYRWRFFQEGKIPSLVTTCSYIYKDKNYTLPIVSIATKQDNMTNSSYGIDVTGSGNGRSGNGSSNAVNFNMDWNRPASFEYLDMDENMNQTGYFQQETDISISGGWSRKQSPRSLKVKASKTYDLNSLDYTFFDTKPYNKNKVLLLRNGGNDDHAKGRIKDAAIHEILRTSGIDLDMQDANPVHVFVNGKYRGMQNMRQPSNKNLAYALYGIDTDEIDVFEISVDSGYVQVAGTRDRFQEWYDLSANAADPDTFEQIKGLLDIDEYCNYMAAQLSLVNWDWPHNNMKGYCERKEDGKFRMVFFDVDNVFEQSIGNPFTNFENQKYYTFYPIFEWGNQQLTLEVEIVTIFLNMLKNEEFKKQFIDSYCLINGSVFEPTRCTEIIERMRQIVQPAMALEGYGNYTNNQANALKNNFSSSRQKSAITYLRNYSRMGLSGKTGQSISLASNIDEGRILVNNLFVPTGKFSGTLFSPITLKAEAPAGYRFKGWKSAGSSTTSTPLISMASKWSYYNLGSLDYTNWKQEGTDVSWLEGTAPFGYANTSKYMYTNAKTKVGSTSDKKVCVYFRKTIQLDKEPSKTDVFRFNYSVDDGFRLHVNGVDVGGYHSYQGDLYNNTSQSHGDNWYEGDNPAEGSIDIPASYFHKGENVIAVDVHNCNETSSDLFFDASLELVSIMESDEDFVSTEAEWTMPESGDYNFEAVFVEETDEDILLASGTVPVKVNEVSAGNSVNVNDHFKKDDWIELYNNTDQEQDIAGMFISDKAKTPLKFQIPADLDGLQTIIPPHGYLVLWASKRDIIGSQIHTNFKLDNDADKTGCVILTAADKTWSDTLTYVKHEGQESVGRYPDGGRNVYKMSRPTISQSNILTSNAAFLYEYLYTGINGGGSEDAIQLAQIDENATTIQYYSLNGMAMGNDTNRLRPGIYLVKFRDKLGNTHTIKQAVH